MAKCEICGKQAQFGYNVSHAHNKTRRDWRPNVQRLRVNYQGTVRRMYVCTRCIRSNRVTKAV
jgi:large subunit ribosomal protein L28